MCLAVYEEIQIRPNQTKSTTNVSKDMNVCINSNTYIPVSQNTTTIPREYINVSSLYIYTYLHICICIRISIPLLDLGAALKLQPHNVKALYRRAQALLTDPGAGQLSTNKALKDLKLAHKHAPKNANVNKALTKLR